MSIYINNQKLVPSEFMKFEVENDEVTGFVDYCEGLAESETKD